VIANLISEAKESVYVQAYGITSNEIVDQLIATHARGVKVRILLDKSNLTDKYSKMQQMLTVGIDVSIDKVSGIAHNKVIIIDEQKVITGSFNFTKSADTRNAENVIIVNDRHVASKYLQNWLSRKSKNEHRSVSDTNKSNKLKVKSNAK
jgi:phospholipase D